MGEFLGISHLLNIDTSDQEIVSQAGADIIEGKELAVINNSPGGVGGSRHLALRVSSWHNGLTADVPSLGSGRMVGHSEVMFTVACGAWPARRAI